MSCVNPESGGPPQRPNPFRPFLRWVAPIAALVVASGTAYAACTDVSSCRGEDVVFFQDGFEPLDPWGDEDGDGLRNGVETATGVYRGPEDAGTSPRHFDTDGDGLLDGDEVRGTASGFFLPALGVSPVHKDVILEYDWFDDAQGGVAHSHRPSQAVLDGVAATLASAPVGNPDGVPGIRAIQDVGQGGAFAGGARLPSATGNLPGVASGPAYRALEAQHLSPARRGYVHYVLSVHHQENGASTSSGSATIPGYQMVVSLGASHAQTSAVRNTILHELGHNFGLDHGGNESCNQKPNYPSVMNYTYQFAGVDADCDGAGDGGADYSRGTRLPLDERNLNETAGMCRFPVRPVDWNRNGRWETGVSLDLNPAGGCAPVLSVLTDHDDWGRVNLWAVRVGLNPLPALKQQAVPTANRSCPPPPLPENG